MKVSGIVYIESIISLNVSECKKSGLHKLVWSCHLAAAGKIVEINDFYEKKNLFSWGYSKINMRGG